MESCGPFTLVEKLATSGVCETWRAVKVSEGRGGPQYAVKRLLPEIDLEGEYAVAFQSLGASAMSLKHERVVRTVDAGVQPSKNQLERPRHYVAQELVVGAPLNAVL